ncbi:unnamed protein product (macronuclear) [Paramecium tetraurelia]|uniref:Protein kinase domain-containing protein n=1 Tax=Paramecium tetraurelia TaxID=5888 RepID=A0ED18_PARTE|nr:uncharacterized protein GSPATT00004054001 [Paramecium tetraurelia]CAK93185.1 unnamed protein product [Paramecium tetraurelia]|eukprot:XP_001460582.1 hypothetical protein (macronuclear) [Paramecium tetraurelia strain d4-2]
MQQQQTQVGQGPLWQAVPQDFVFPKPKFEATVTKLGKKQHERHLVITDKHILLFKDKSKHVHKLLPLDFTTRFEIFRDAPVLKANASQKKSTPNTPASTRADIVKPEDVQTLGDILHIRLQSENTEKFWDFTGDQEILKTFRKYFGQKINQMGFHHMFKVFKKIGKGNFASVYLAERIEDGQQMAIKAFSKSAVYAEENGKEGLINEITIMRELDHPNIMKLYEVYETQNSLYMGLELLQGGQLYEIMKKKVILTNKQIQSIMRGLLEGLAHMHSKNIMHRDLKLENILFKEQNDINSVVIADFGLATFVNLPVYLYCRCGTPGFVAPEVINITDMSTTYDSVCDIYSLGLVFHILLTGKPGFPGRSYNTIVQQNKEAKINFKSPVFDVVPPPAFELLKHMLEPSPKKRITATDALKYEFVALCEKTINAAQEDDGNIGDIDDKPGLNVRIQQINEQAAKFDMLRINQLTNSPIKSPVMQATNKMKEVQNKDQQMIMRTPVITGRTVACEESPNMNQFVSPSVQFKKLQQNQQQAPTGNVLLKYTQKPQQQQQTNTEDEKKDQSNIAKSVKAALSKHV